MVLDVAAMEGVVAATRDDAPSILVAPVSLLNDPRRPAGGDPGGPRLHVDQGTSCWLHVDPDVVGAAVDLWRTTVRHAVPLPDHVVQLTARERRIARGLVDGLTDGSMARALGVSLRTVASEVRMLMEAVDARSRYQAGVRLTGS
ncbi:MAG: helix-turn-helix transcriptional regulator [Oryzihumus sp.]